MSNLALDFVINFVAGVAGIIVVLWIERQRRASLYFEAVTPPQEMKGDTFGRPDAKWVHVAVHNAKMRRWLRWAYNREPAFMCQAYITFHRTDGTQLYEREMLGRWDSSPEPEIVPIPVDDKIYPVLKHYPYSMDIPSGAASTLAIAIRVRGDGKCFGFCNDSYRYQTSEQKWRHPDWELQSGVFIARVRVVSNGREFADAFRIVNDVRYEDFRLEPLTDPELRKALKLK